MNKIGKERGWAPMTHQEYSNSAALRGANFVGTPQQVIDKILFQYDIFEHDRFMVQFSVGHHAARQDHALDRALRNRGCPGGPRGGSSQKINKTGGHVSKDSGYKYAAGRLGSLAKGKLVSRRYWICLTFLSTENGGQRWLKC